MKTLLDVDELQNRIDKIVSLAIEASIDAECKNNEARKSMRSFIACGISAAAGLWPMIDEYSAAWSSWKPKVRRLDAAHAALVAAIGEEPKP